MEEKGFVKKIKEQSRAGAIDSANRIASTSSEQGVLNGFRNMGANQLQFFSGFGIKRVTRDWFIKQNITPNNTNNGIVG